MTNSANNPIRIIAPSILTDIAWNEAEVLGGFVWLWQYHDYYRQASIESAISIILPIIQSKNFAFLVYKNQPLGYINWAYLSPERRNWRISIELSHTSFLHNSINPNQIKKYGFCLGFVFPK